MPSRKTCSGVPRRFFAILFFLSCLVSGASAAPRVGRAVVVRMSGRAEFRYPEKTAHEALEGRGRLHEGMALSEPQSIITGDDGHLCVVLTPGAVLCVAPDTEIKIEKLEQLTEGLPSSEKDLKKTITLSMKRGAVLVHGGVPSPNMSIRIRAPVGTVSASGGDFVVAGKGREWQVVVETYGVTFEYDGKKKEVGEGQTLDIERGSSGGRVTVQLRDETDDDMGRTFDVCRTFFDDLEPFVFRTDGADRDGLSGWIGSPSGMVLIGDPTVWHDISPSFRIPPPRIQTDAATSARDNTGRLMPGEEIWMWYRSLGVIRGVNYIPRTAVNSTEMWQEGTFDPDTIDEELEWARKAGFNSLRVHLQYLVWKEDRKGFMDRLEEFLSIAREHGMSTVFVLFDDTKTSGKEPYAGKQADPVPGVHNSGWTPSPGLERVPDRTAWPDLERYVKDVIGEFRRDKRVLFWDLYNAPGNAGMWDRSLPLLEATFRWAREADSSQPLTSGPWTEFGSPMSVRIMELSDLVSLRTFDDAEGVRAQLMACRRFRRPIVCTDWLKRQKGNTFKEILPVFAEAGVGWYSRGLVRGKTQAFIPEDHEHPGEEPDVWQHDLLDEEGEPYDRKELELIGGFRFDQ